MSEHVAPPERIFLCTEGDASKFWRVRVENSLQTVRYGRIGTDGHELTKTFDNAVLASKATEKLIREKLGKGYREVPEKEAEAAHDAARSSEDVTATATPKPRQVGKRRATLGHQLTLALEAEDEDRESSTRQATLPTEFVSPQTLALEF